MDEALEILAEGPIEVAGVRVVWDAARVVLPAAAEARVEERWGAYLAEARAAGRELFNGGIVRLVGVNVMPPDRREGDSPNMPSGAPAPLGMAPRVLELTLGPGDYKHFLVMMVRDRGWFAEHAAGLEVAGLGNSVLLTRGEEALLGVRSGRVAAYPGRVHLFGGVLDLTDPLKPQRTQRAQRTDDGTLEGDLGAVGFDVRELLGHLRRELWEEAGVGAAELVGMPQVLVVARDLFLMQPEVVWQWEVRKDLGEIARRVDRAEHEGSEVVRRGAVERGLWGRMTPMTRAAVERWGRGK